MGNEYKRGFGAFYVQIPMLWELRKHFAMTPWSPTAKLLAACSSKLLLAVCLEVPSEQRAHSAGLTCAMRPLLMF